MCTVLEKMIVRQPRVDDKKFITKNYVVLESGPTKTIYHHLKDTLSIGASPKNDVYLSDPAVSNHHVILFTEASDIFIEDKGSKSGTFVNNENISKALLENDDIIRCGNTTLRIVKEYIPLNPNRVSDIIAAKPVKNRDMRPKGTHYPSKRLLELLPEIPLFESLKKEDLTDIIDQMRFVLYEENRIIFRQGDVGRCLYIVLDGKVEVSIEHENQKEIRLAVLGENQFFGEMSFLTGAPRSAAVRTLETTYLCELNPDTLNDLFYKSPQIQSTLWAYYHRRLNDTNETKRTHGIQEKRKFVRYNICMKLKVSFHRKIDRNGENITRTLHLSTRDISIGGAAVRIPCKDIKKIYPGQGVLIEFTLPDSGDDICCRGIIKKISNTARRDLFGYFSIEFKGLQSEQKAKLEAFLNNIPCN